VREAEEAPREKGGEKSRRGRWLKLGQAYEKDRSMRRRGKW